MSPSEQLPGVRTIEWNEFPHFRAFPKMTGAVKPWYPSFFIKARKWIRDAQTRGETFDLIHQLTPLALRFPSPAIGLHIPFIIGPLAGSLSTPPHFKNECGSAPLFTYLRALDGFRFQWDPLLRKTYKNAEIILCSSPYVESILAPIDPKRTMIFCEVGIDSLADAKEPRARDAGELRLLHVGRAVRTKGLRDAVRAMAMLKDLPKVTLDVAGAGEELEVCKEEARHLGVADKIRFHGRLSRTEIETLYTKSDVFLFPSFREPTGIVLFEAMRHGLPVITADRGGPGHIVDETCGIKVAPEDPTQFAQGIAIAIRTLATDATKAAQMGKAARSRAGELGLWPNKIRAMLNVYEAAIVDAGRPRSYRHGSANLPPRGLRDEDFPEANK
jgi:glycosyltransferase involved in cell wall biosynthesis